MAQKNVQKKLAFGIAGEFYDSSVKRVTPATLGGAAVIGKAAWVDGDGKAYGTAASGAALTGVFVSPKEYINRSADLGSTMEMPAGSVAQVATLGHINVTACNAVEVGNSVFVCKEVNTAATGFTGSWATGDFAGSTGATPTATGVTFAAFNGAKFVRVKASAGEVAVVEING